MSKILTSKFNKTVLLSISLALFLIFVGCASPEDEEQEPEENGEQENAENVAGEQNGIYKEDEIKLYFIKDTGTEFVKVSETRSVDKVTPEETMELFLEGPENEDYLGAGAADVSLLGVTMEEGLASVDFSKELYDMSLGHEPEARFVDSIVYTLTQFDEIEEIQILVEGETAEPISGHIDISEPLSRENS
ncbi:GerMN domain-containing protein [Natranaerobius thermophilus]|uniref:Spore germination protein-like protein n=1 Tax=Natranaerobius thermophilus (strain ATCC BAA-1301 / DSM 18059 / JW/NM-WN-LF) TaxID=457570 RepID=B2A1A4_NATTJ|nr:GerMN domain-containing protein [Natranaerobius thermophilus]ACB86042.1 spore germination protein-like protein [Natranaerobius thermophilus JW/NM-WN-LF]